MSAPLPQNEAELVAIARYVGAIQGAIIGAMAAQGTDVRELARRIKSTPTAVGRVLGADDMHVGTAALMFDALGLKWTPVLEEKE